MARPHLQILGQADEFLHGRIQLSRRGLHRPFDRRRLLEQIGSTQRPDEYEISREHPHRLAGPAAPIRDQKREVFGRVAGGVMRGEIDVADRKTVAVVQPHDVVLALLWPGVAPLLRSCVGEVDARAALGELSNTREEVSMDMRLCGRDDAKAFGRRDLDVAVDIALGVDDQGFAGLLTPDQIGVLREFVVDDLSKEHASVRGSVVGPTARAGIPSAYYPQFEPRLRVSTAARQRSGGSRPARDARRVQGAVSRPASTAARSSVAST